MTPHSCLPDGGGGPARRLLPWLILLLVLVAVPTAALDTLYLVRHGEKAEGWPQDADLDPFWPLSPEGAARAERLAVRLGREGIAAAYTSRTTRTLSTALPLAARLGIPLSSDDASLRPESMPDFLRGVRERHPYDRAVLIVGHSNTVPHLLTHLGATPGCYSKLGIVEREGALLIEGYEGLWKVDLKRRSCEAIARESLR